MKSIFSALGLALALSITACNNSGSDNHSSATEQGHDNHEGHDHGAHAAPTTSSAQTAPPAQPAKQEPAATIPEFKFYKVKSGFGYEKKDIPAGKNTVFILFDPSCGHCQQETQALAKNYDKLKNVNLVYVSMNDPGLMVNFLPSFGKELDGKENVEMLYDRNQEFINKFHIPDMFPANYVYGADGKLKSYWVGEKHIEEILASIVQ